MRSPDVSEKMDTVSWALAYPFDVPDGSFLYVNGSVFHFDEHRVETWRDGRVMVEDRPDQIRDVLTRYEITDEQIESPRVPVIACGSNASPQRLKQKYDRDLPGSVVPTFRVTLTNYSVVFAAKFTEYGSVPATLAHTPGSTSQVYINLLTPAQLQVMDGTETLGCSYDRPILDDAGVEAEDGFQFSKVHAYISRHGCFTPHGQPVSLSGVKSDGHSFPVMEQTAVQQVAKRLLDSSLSLEDFVYENISNEPLRRERSRYLADEYSIPAGRSAS